MNALTRKNDKLTCCEQSQTRTYTVSHCHAVRSASRIRDKIVTHILRARARAFPGDIASKREDVSPKRRRICVSSSQFIGAPPCTLANFAYSTQIAFRFASHFRNNMGRSTKKKKKENGSLRPQNRSAHGCQVFWFLVCARYRV